MSTTKGTQHLSGELQSASDLDFYIDGVRIFHVIISCRLQAIYFYLGNVTHS